LKDAAAENRVAAVRLAAAPGIDQLAALVPLLGPVGADPAPEVRRLALVALGRSEELITTDDLLPLLHDEDVEVQLVCARALRSRGLRESHVELARAMSHPQPSVRAGVPARVLEISDLDSRVWLEKLSRDQSPAVRAAVLRMAGERRQLTLRPRVEEMARNDPSPTIQQLARFYAGQLRAGDW
jgi:HEAT repeat protein